MDYLQKKAYEATWIEEEDSTENKVVNLCFMALEEGEVTSNSSISNSYTFDELQEAYDELVFEFKASFSKNKKMISKFKLENERLSKTNLEFEAKLKEYEINFFDLQNLLQTLENDHQNDIDDLKNKNDLISKELEKNNTLGKSFFYERQSSVPRFIKGKCSRSIWVPKGLNTSTKKDEIEKWIPKGTKICASNVHGSKAIWIPKYL
ncbi:hypothetical protein GQ457_07G008300 [Hibiscus cannabinus]